MMWFGWGFMWGPICLIVIAVGIYFLIKSQTHETCSAHTPTPQIHTANNRAIELLKERYAKGEITKEQFLEMKQELQK